MQIKHYHFDEVSSTNTVAETLIKTKRPLNPFFITTDYQTEGKGTKDKKWHSERNNNLLYSLVMYSENPVINPADMVLTAAHAIKDLLEKEYSVDVTIKHPNDIFLNQKKCGGILIKNIIQGNQCWTIIGIGLNLNSTQFPSHLSKIATSVYLETSKKISIIKFRNDLTKTLITSYQKIMNRV